MTDIKRLDAKTALKSNIKTLREKLGMSQGELAAKIGLSQKSMSEIESGKRWPDYKTIQALSKALSAEETDLLSDPNMVSAFNFMSNRK
jgi:putative transcriptional regulator